MRTRFVIFSLIVSFFPLVACSVQQTRPTFVPSKAQTPSATFAPLPTQTLTKAPTSTLTPTPTYPLYPTKQIMLEYGHYEGHGFFKDILSPNIPTLVLYTDGQLILTSGQFREKVLSEAEISDLLSKLERRGLYRIETNQKHDLTDRLYNFGNKYQQVFDGGYSCISVYSKTSRELCAYEPYEAFLIPSMKDLLLFLDRYTPDGLSLYHPDRILLEIQHGSDFLPEEYKTTSIDWPNTLPSLGTAPRMYAEGETAAEIFALFDYSAKWQTFDENGSEFTAFARPVLPDESLVQP